MMTVDGVVFFEDVVRSMDEEKFVEECAPLFYPDIPEEERKAKLSGIYGKICGKPKAKSRESGSEQE